MDGEQILEALIIIGAFIWGVIVAASWDVP